MDNDEPRIKVENLYKSFADKTTGEQVLVLENINLEIRKGERLCIVGQTGCGKTVLVKHFNRLEEPDKGWVLVYGKDLAEMKDRKLDEIKRKTQQLW